MKLKHYKKNTFGLCSRWRFDPHNPKKLDMMVGCLMRWIRSERGCVSYGYKGDVRMWVSYCSDRMNPGRALALVHLLDEHGWIDIHCYGLDRGGV